MEEMENKLEDIQVLDKEDVYQQAADLIKNADVLLLSLGAGASADSGLPW